MSVAGLSQGQLRCQSRRDDWNSVQSWSTQKQTQPTTAYELQLQCISSNTNKTTMLQNNHSIPVMQMRAIAQWPMHQSCRSLIKIHITLLTNYCTKWTNTDLTHILATVQ